MKLIKYFLGFFILCLSITAGAQESQQTYNQFTCKPKGDAYTYELIEYLSVYEDKADIGFVHACCEHWAKQGKYCHEGYISRHDGNTLVLAAAEYSPFNIFSYFASIRKFPVDVDWKLNWEKGKFYKSSLTELQHAIRKNDLEMVKFLLGREGKGGNEKQLSNPRRKNPMELDARDYARNLRGKINPEIIKLVEESWENSLALPERTEIQKRMFAVLDNNNEFEKKENLYLAINEDSSELKNSINKAGEELGLSQAQKSRKVKI